MLYKILKEFIIKSFDCVHQTGKWYILYTTEGLGKLENKAQSKEEITSRLLNEKKSIEAITCYHC